MKKTITVRKGITFIEVMVSIAIIGTLSALTWSTISNARKQTQVSNSCESLVAIANKARGYALAGISGADQVRLSCTKSSASCKIEKHTVTPSAWVELESLTFQGDTNINTTTLVKTYSIPYGNSAGSVSGTMQLSGGAPQKNFIIDSFKATCQ